MPHQKHLLQHEMSNLHTMDVYFPVIIINQIKFISRRQKIKKPKS